MLDFGLSDAPPVTIVTQEPHQREGGSQPATQIP